MKNKWMAVGWGIVFKGEINKLKLAIFRKAENKRAYPMLVRCNELQLNDILFLETADRSDYCVLNDFHCNELGAIDYWVFTESGIETKKQEAMMKLTKELLDQEFDKINSEGETLLISVKQRNPNQANGNE